MSCARPGNAIADRSGRGGCHGQFRHQGGLQAGAADTAQQWSNGAGSDRAGVSGDQRHRALQAAAVHFHKPSEEVLYGPPYPMAAHFVHVDHAGNLAVLGVLFEEGAHNAELGKLIRAAPAHEREAEAVKGATCDPGKLLPANLAVYRYECSLTTSPCTEGVRWHVARHRSTASAAQIAALHAIMGDNARPM
ncbi:carbonic anhydrase family protein [Novosphingobium aquae]|uniref:carbonic anhydrase n=1 Tax=Novosphingobium aquae TaxID=3133435 RepID=A0ABU8SA77_9SPHN